MKKLFFAFVLTLTSQVYAQSISAGTTAVFISPFATATRVLESAVATMTAGTQTALAPFATTSASIEARGVAGKEQMRDELVDLDRDMRNGLVQELADIRQPSLKEVMLEIAQDKEEMERIHALIPEGNEALKIATVVTLKLFY